MHAPKQVHDHNLDSVALNYPCPVSWLMTVRHNKTKCRENGTRERSYLGLYKNLSWVSLDLLSSLRHHLFSCLSQSNHILQMAKTLQQQRQ
jgi:hypothetical protein